MKTVLCLSALLAALVGCGPKAGINETRMVYAPARQPDCALQLVQADPTSPDFNRKWQVLGYITFLDAGTQDPMAERNRALARPRACKMGGTSIAVATSSTNTYRLARDGSGVVYMVLRPKSSRASEPTSF